MQVGPRAWQFLSTDTAGVPSGGPFGNVKRFESRAKRHGLLVAWSKPWECFAIYSKHGPSKYVHHILCHREGGLSPMPLTDEMLSMLLEVWDKHCKLTHESITAKLSQLARDEKRKRKDQYAKAAEEMEKEVMRAVDLRQGYSTPNLISLPHGLVGVR